MENAGRSCAELIKEKLCDIVRPKVSIFCGTGNNGGDGFVIARHLLNNSYEVDIVVCGDCSKIRGDAKVNLDILERMGQKIVVLDPAGDGTDVRIKALASDADMIVDSLFGTGLSGQLSPEYCRLIEAINALSRPTLAVDIPSGLDCDTGKPLGAAIRAAWTVTFVAVKKGFLRPEAPAYTGEIFVASIGIEPTIAGGMV
jgi:NAD(P)H-hydrate epimerase